MDILNLNKSKLKSDILKLYFSHPEKLYYIRELEKKLNRPAAYIRRELMKLESEGLFLSEFIGNQRYFKLNRDFFLYKEVEKIVNKTIGIEGSLRKIVEKNNFVKQAYIFGSYAKNKLSPESDIDLLIISADGDNSIREEIYQLQSEFGREINIIDMDEKELADRKRKKDELLKNIFSGELITLKCPSKPLPSADGK